MSHPLKPVPGVTPPPPMDHLEMQRIRDAGFLATRLLGGPVGDMVKQDLDQWADFGWRLGHGKDALVMAVVGDLERRWEQARAARAAEAVAM